MSGIKNRKASEAVMSTLSPRQIKNSPLTDPFFLVKWNGKSLTKSKDKSRLGETMFYSTWLWTIQSHYPLIGKEIYNFLQLRTIIVSQQSYKYVNICTDTFSWEMILHSESLVKVTEVCNSREIKTTGQTSKPSKSL